MLEELSLSDLGVIEEATLELGPGLTVITGETGAGKTMVVTALGLLLGGRADSGLVRSGARRCRIEGRVLLGDDSPLWAEVAGRVEQAGGDLDDGVLLLGRSVAAEGRSRASLGGASVPVGRLAELADQLVAVHGQADQWRLRHPGRQRDALDRYGGDRLGKALTAYRATYDALRHAEHELVTVSETVRDRAREAELLRLGLGELEQADLRSGEDAELLAEEERLANTDALRAAADQARLLLTGDDADSAAATNPGAAGLLDRARRELEHVRDHDAAAGALADRIAELAYLSTDLGSEVTAYAAGVDADPARLEAVQQRRALIGSLARKYGETVDEMLAWQERSAKRLLELDNTDERIERLRADVERLRTELAERAGELSRRRRTAAGKLSTAVTKELGALAMRHARLEVRCEPTDPGPHGADEVAFLLAANADATARPLDRGASGGELSRVMLALEVVLADRSPVPTLVFDEVDAGVGGRAATEVGRRLARLGRRAQVLVVTHLPQVAAYADTHYSVVKSDAGSVTRSGLHRLDAEDRVQELSRMLAGVEESAAAQAHARELIDRAADDTPASRRTPRRSVGDAP